MTETENWRKKPRPKKNLATAKERLKNEKDPIKKEQLRFLAALHEYGKINELTRTELIETVLGQEGEAPWRYATSTVEYNAVNPYSSRIKPALIRKMIEHDLLPDSDLTFIVLGKKHNTNELKLLRTIEELNQKIEEQELLIIKLRQGKDKLENDLNVLKKYLPET